MLKQKISEFWKNNLINKSIIVLALRVIGVLLFFSLTLFLTNNFDPSDIGKYDFSRSLLLFLGGVAILGMHQSIIYYSGYLSAQNNLGYISEVYKKMLFIVLGISLILLVLMMLVSSEHINAFFNKDVALIVVKTIAAIFFYAITMLNVDAYRAVNKIYVSEFIRNIIRFAPFFVAVIILNFTDNKELLVDVFLLNFVAIGLLSTVAICILLFRSKNEYIDVESPIDYRAIIKRSAPMAVSAIAYILMQSVDVILLSKFSSFNAVAIYSVALKLTMIVALVLASVNTVQGPKIAELYSSKNTKALSDIIKKATRLIFIMTIPILLVLLIASKHILGLFGDTYVAGQSALIILLVGQSVNALCGSVGIYMNMTNKQNVFQLILIIALVINVILNWTLIPLYDIKGAAIATTISMSFWNVVCVAYIYKKDKIKTFLS